MKLPAAGVLLWFVLGLSPMLEAQSLKKVHAAIPSISPSSAAFVLARDRGYFREEGLDVDLIVMPAAVANQALLGGNVEFMGTGGAGMVPALRGAPLQLLFVTFYRPQYWLYARPEIRSIEDLKGKRVGVSSIGSGPDSLLRDLLKKYGLEGGRDVTIMAMGAGTARFHALQAGSVDSAMLTPPANFMAQEAGFRQLVSFIEQDLVEVQGCVFMRQESIKSDPVLTEKLVRGSLKGLLYFHSQRSGSIASLARFLKTKEDLTGRLYDLILPGVARDGAINEELQKRSIEHIIERVGIKESPPLGRIFNFSVARKAREGLTAKGWKP